MAILFGRDQLPVFLSFLVCGVLAGVLFDVLKIKRHMFGAPGFIVFIDDLNSCLHAVSLSFLTPLLSTTAILNGTKCRSCSGGFAVYRLTLSRIVIFCIFAVIDFVKKMLRKLVTPLVRLTLKQLRKFKKRLNALDKNEQFFA